MESLQDIISLVNKNDIKKFLIRKIHQKNNQQITSKSRESAQKENRGSPNRKQSKFLLLKLINNNRLRFIRNPRFQKNRKEIFQFFQNKLNLIKLLDAHNVSPKHNYLNFRPFKQESKSKEPPSDNGIYYKIVHKGAAIVKDILIDNGLCPSSQHSKCVFFWNNGSVKLEFFAKLQAGQKFNHFPFSNQITRKDYMFINIMKIKNKFKEHYDFIPNSFLLPQDTSLLSKYFEQNKNKIYICKPSCGS